MIPFLLKWKYLIAFLIILLISLYLRFHGYESDPTREFGWDQARDAWKVRDIVAKGQIVLEGPKTGIGNLHLGPLYFYLMAPFYYITRLDPVGSLYFLIIANIFNFSVVYIITKKIFSQKTALFAVFIFGVSNYITKQSMIPWNVSLVPGISLLLFYAIYTIKTHGKRYWYYLVGLLMGFFFNLHFTAVFLPIIVGLSLFPYDRKWKNLLPLTITFLIAGLFLIPTILFSIRESFGEAYRYKDFLSHYTHGFYGQFFLTRLTESFVQFRMLTFFPFISTIIQFFIPLTFYLVVYFEKNKHLRLFGLLMIPWFIVPLLFFTVYAGPVSDYYYYFQMPLIILMLIYLQKKLVHVSPKFLLLLIPFWIFYAVANTQEFWVKENDGGLNKSKREALPHAREGRIIEYNEGDIKSYLYHVWTENYMPDDSVTYEQKN